MTAPRPRLLTLCIGLIGTVCLASCSSSSPGRGTGAGPHTLGAPSTQQPAPSTSLQITVPSPTAPTTAPTTPTAPASKPTTPPPPTPTPTPTKSRTTAPTSGGGTYVGRGNPNTWCGSSQLAVTAARPAGGGAAGHTAVVLRFLNNSHYACVLYGYPGADGVNGGGRSTAHAARTTDGYVGGCNCASPRGVRIAPGETASALVEGDLGGSGNCDAFRGLLVTPPNTYQSTPLDLAPHSCDFQVHPVVIGSTGTA